MKKVLAIIALVCSLACTAVSPLAANVSADKTINAGGTNLEYDPNYTDPNKKLPNGNGNGEEELKTRAKTIVEVLLGFVGVVSVIMIIWGGIMYSYSSGDPSKTQLAKRIIISAIIGLIFSLLAFVILNVVVTVAQGGTL